MPPLYILEGDGWGVLGAEDRSMRVGEVVDEAEEDDDRDQKISSSSDSWEERAGFGSIMSASKLRRAWRSIIEVGIVFAAVPPP